LAEAGSGRTDWIRLRALDDSELEAAVADDADCFALTGRIVSRNEARTFRQVVHACRFGRFKPWTRTLRQSELRKLDENFAALG